MSTSDVKIADTIRNRVKVFLIGTLVFFGIAIWAPGDVFAQVCNSMSFSDVTLTAGINHKYNHPSTAGNPMTGGAVAEDFDGDGWLDLYVVQGAGGANMLYMNDQVGGFTDEAAARNADLQMASVAASAADYDNDGDIDIAVSVAENNSRVLVNDGTGNFPTHLLLPNPLQVAMSSSWGDVDNDGLLELAIGQWNEFEQAFFLYKNNGGGTLTQYEFRNVPRQENFIFSPRFADLNGDGLQDLHVVGDFLNSQLYMNRGGGMFDNVTAASGVGGASGGQNEMGHAIGDYDNDGDNDMFTSNIHTAGGNRLYNNNGSGVFSRVQSAANVVNGNWGWGASFGDLDNDGDLDLYHVNGWHGDQQFIDQPARLFMNNGNGTFNEVAGCAGADDRGLGKGMLQFDYDNDGDLDIYIVNSQDMAVVGEDFPGTPALLRNNTNNGNHWLKVTLDAAPPLHRNGIGSRAYAQVGGTTLMHELHASTNFLAQNAGRIAHFGLGSATTVSEVKAEWVSGDATIIPDVAADQQISVPGPVATVSTRQLAIGETVTADASAESAPVEWEVEGVMYADPATVSFASGGSKDLTLLVYDAGQTVVIRKEVLRVDVTAAQITAPVPGSVLSGDTETFEWTGNGVVVTDWQLQIGTSVGGNSLFDSGVLASGTLSAVVTGLPLDGSTLYVRLSYTVEGELNTIDYTYLANGALTDPEITSPVPGSTLTSSSATFVWADNGAGVTNWRLRVGSTVGGFEYHQSNILGPGDTSTTVSGLPTDGSTVYVEFSWIDGVLGQAEIMTTDYTYTAYTDTGGGGGTDPEITSPAPDSTLTGSTATFSWADNGAGVTNWRISVGSSVGGNDYYQSAVMDSGDPSATVSGLPVDGSTVYVEFSWITGVLGQAEIFTLNYTYTAFTDTGGGGTDAEITVPVPGSTIAGGSATFEWADNGSGVTNWRVVIGTTVGGNDLYISPVLDAGTATTTATGLPTDGSTIYVEFSWINGVLGQADIIRTDYTYTTGL